MLRGGGGRPVTPTARGVASELAQRQVASSPGTPGGPDPCLDLLELIIHLLNEVAQRFNDAVNDRHNLFRDHRRLRDAGPHGSWEGHQQRYASDQEKLRYKIAEWDADDPCRNYRLSPQQQEDLNEAREFGDKPFPSRPANTMREMEVGPEAAPRVGKVFRGAAIGATVGGGLGAVLGALLGGAGGTLVLPGVGTVGGGAAGAIEGAGAGAAMGAGIGAAMGGLIEWLSD
jgi:hypothetical protein